MHAVVPFSGRSLWAVVWSISDQLGIVSRSPAELVAALKGDGRRTVMVLPDLHDDAVAELVGELAALPHLRLIVEARTGSPTHRRLSGGGCAELDLDLEQWKDQARFEAWQASQSPAAPETESSDVPMVNPSDPVAVCSADPWLVTAAFEGADPQHDGGLRDAWLRAGQSLVREQAPGSRALSLLSVLGDGADPRLAPVLAQLAEQEACQVLWSRVRGDVRP
ncbi:hypothetical protein ACFWR5_30570, partial [Streptomyces sp. NPDC058613]